MERDPGPRAAVLLMQEAVFDARIWAPLADALRGEADVVESDPPPSPMLFAPEHWAVHTADWLAARCGDRPVSAVVAHGHAGTAALEAAARGLVRGAAVLIDPPATALIGELGEAAVARMHEMLGGEAAQEKLGRLFTQLSVEDMQELRETGRLDAAGAARFAEAITGLDADRAEPYELAKAMLTERLIEVFARGVEWRPPPLGIDFPGIAASLGPRLHLALTPETVIELLELRPRLAADYPRAVLHTLPGPVGPAGWWRETAAYAALVRTAIADPVAG